MRRSFRRLSFDGKDGASGGEQRWSEIVFSLLRSLGVNYLWGIANFTVGVTLGGIWVAVALIGKMVQ